MSDSNSNEGGFNFRGCLTGIAMVTLAILGLISYDYDNFEGPESLFLPLFLILYLIGVISAFLILLFDKD